MDLASVRLDDKYALDSGRIYVTGTQALVRLPMMQRERDRAAGLNTACFISGYRGSPLGALDQQLWKAKTFLKEHDIHFQPGVNEDLAATALWGSQQTGLFPGAKVDGVFGMWYAKGPGVDRSGDALRHANLAGTSRHGGVLALAGDDHTCKSSTTAHQSEYAFMDAMIPILNPAGVQEFLDLGLYGWAMSRYAGTWVAFKTVAETVDTSASVQVDPHRIRIAMPSDFELPEGGLNIRWPDTPLQQEERLHRWKLYAALAFARANKLDRIVIDGPKRRFGIVTAGKTYLDVLQALEDLGIDEAHAAELGLSVYKVGMTWPLEREGIRHFCEGLEEVLVVEEKRAIIENQLKEQLYNWRADVRPRVIGKFDEKRNWILPSSGELTPAMIARVIAQRIAYFHDSERIHQRLDAIERIEAEVTAAKPAAERIPHFCSGCPHNTSTKVPEGSRALAGIGCHYMVLWMNRQTDTFTHMGAEGVTWVGLSPFMDEPHVFTNLGDGTYFHSGILAVRQSIAAGVNITYKLLYNDAVALTGGQPIDGNLSVPAIAHQLAAEGVAAIAIVSDEPDKYPAPGIFPAGTSIHHRDEMETVQKTFRETQGVTLIIYDQTCAAEKRRRRKIGTFPDPARRVFINERVCEGCGDCSTQSNCLSVTPIDTEFGRKRHIDQSSCNKDYSCLNGFCPSFVTVEGGRPRKGKASPKGKDTDFPTLPEPTLPVLDHPYGILVTGIGGTGVVTIGALLGMAAHLEGKGCSVLDMAGLAQKGGPVTSHVRIAAKPEDIKAVRIASAGARLILGCDMVVAAGKDALSKIKQGETRAVVNAHQSITAAFTRDPDWRFPDRALAQSIAHAAGEGALDLVDATQLATRLMGDSIATNPFMLGYAWQKGLIPVSAEAIEKAIELNGVAVAANCQAFLWGRRTAHDPAAVRAIAFRETQGSARPAPAETLDDILAIRIRDLTAYQNAAYAGSYADFVGRIRRVEDSRIPGSDSFTKAVARNLYKLMAYKDEYEVARLFSSPEFTRKLHAEFEGDYRLTFHLAPPGLAKPDPQTGRIAKRSFGPWMMPAFRILAKLKGLRGTPFDPFGRTEERRNERRLIAEYRATIESLLPSLSADNLALALEIVEIPDRIRGYGPIKEKSLAEAKARESALLARYRAGKSSAPPIAAE